MSATVRDAAGGLFCTIYRPWNGNPSTNGMTSNIRSPPAASSDVACPSDTMKATTRPFHRFLTSLELKLSEGYGHTVDKNPEISVMCVVMSQDIGDSSGSGHR